MVHVASFIGALLFAGVASALPRPDSAINEPAVAAPDGIKITLTGATSTVASSSASSVVVSSSASYPAATAASSSSSSSSVSQSTQSSNSYGGSSNSYGSNSYGGSSGNSWSYSYSWAAAAPEQTSKSYGSGYNNWGWGGSDYNNCVQQCVAQFGAPPSTYTPPPSVSSDSMSGSSSSKTHTIIVAPTQGVKRFIPPMMSVPPGDTVNFVWRANNHTVTKSSQLLPCNKTADKPFASGEQNMGFQFQETVNDTNPVFYYCGTPGHCEVGMWGVLNPSTSNGSDSVSVMMPQMISNDSSLSAMWAYMNDVGSQHNASNAVMNWGGKYNVSSVPSWAQGELMQNIMFTRMFLAMNPETLRSDGSIDMSATTAPLSFPADISSALAGSNNAASSTPNVGSSSAASSGSASQTASTTPSASPSAAGKTSGARSTVVSSALLGVAVLAVSVLAL
ncbi:hypothetical protein BDY19DRAFT_989179 [Irpex rosettiformis]|uniref:Uncharacterized protein n=1 Tax=Irpex rosettiformis TaxID=378272 RepID=A0ACB8UH78_9APHY|nr:hypothetical protein BDY19DRAFT_989179 [Irpex rosettiformis]